MRQFNLLSGTGERRLAHRVRTASFLLLCVVGSLTMLVGALASFHLTRRAEVARNGATPESLEHEIAAIRARTIGHADLARKLAEVQRREAVLDSLVESRRDPALMLLEISRLMSLDDSVAWNAHRLWLTGIDEERQRIRISGEGRSADDVAELMKRFGGSAYFSNVRLDRVEVAGSQLDHAVVQRFSVTAEMTY